MSSLKGKIAVITGGTRGIGYAVARLFIERGAQVALCGRSEESASAAAQRLGSSCIGIGCDVSNPAAVDALIGRVAATWGTVHILVNNAGSTDDGLLIRMKDERLERLIQTNLSSVFYTCRATAAMMMKQRYGRIINIGSVAGLRGNAGQCAYAAAKAGLIGFTKSYAREMASRNITVNLVAPGFIDTEMTASFPEAQRDALLSRVPLQRPGTAEEVAAAVAFLASDEAAYITGATLTVDGGLGA